MADVLESLWRKTFSFSAGSRETFVDDNERLRSIVGKFKIPIVVISNLITVKSSNEKRRKFRFFLKEI